LSGVGNRSEGAVSGDGESSDGAGGVFGTGDRTGVEHIKIVVGGIDRDACWRGAACWITGDKGQRTIGWNGEGSNVGATGIGGVESGTRAGTAA